MYARDKTCWGQYYCVEGKATTSYDKDAGLCCSCSGSDPALFEGPGEAAEDDPSAWVPVLMWRPWQSSSRLLGLALAVAAIWGVKQQTEDLSVSLSLSLCLCNSHFQSKYQKS